MQVIGCAFVIKVQFRIDMIHVMHHQRNGFVGVTGGYRIQ